MISSGTPVYFYHNDHIGSVRAVTDKEGEVVYNADYSAFGNKFGQSGEFDENLGFTGKSWDEDVGLYYYNARWYDPDLGRFISEDPAADPNNPNLYSYCNNNPIMFTDPSGMWLGAALSWLWKSIIIPVWNYIIAPYLIVSTWNGLQAGYKNEKAGGSFWTGFFGAFRNFNLTFNTKFGNGTTSYSLTCDYIPGITMPDPYLSWEAQQARITADWNEYVNQIARIQESDYEFQAQYAVAKWQAEEEARRQLESIDPLKKCNGTVKVGNKQPSSPKRSYGASGTGENSNANIKVTKITKSDGSVTYLTQSRDEKGNISYERHKQFASQLPKADYETIMWGIIGIAAGYGLTHYGAEVALVGFLTGDAPVGIGGGLMVVGGQYLIGQGVVDIFLGSNNQKGVISSFMSDAIQMVYENFGDYRTFLFK